MIKLKLKEFKTSLSFSKQHFFSFYNSVLEFAVVHWNSQKRFANFKQNMA